MMKAVFLVVVLSVFGQSFLTAADPDKAPPQELEAAAQPLKIDESKYGCGPLTEPGRTFYLSVKGDDKADGLSWETAWRSVRRGCGALQAGDTLLIGEGEYYEPHEMALNVREPPKEGVSPQVGSPGRPIRIMAAPNQRVIIRGGRKLGPFKKTEGARHVYEAACPKMVIPVVWEERTQIQFEKGGSVARVDELPGTYHYDPQTGKIHVRFADSRGSDAHAVYVYASRVGLRIHSRYVQVKGLWFLNYCEAILMRPNEDKERKNLKQDGDHLTIEECGFFANASSGLHAYGVTWCLFKNNCGGMNEERGGIMTQTEDFKDNLIIGNRFESSAQTLRIVKDKVHYAINQYGGVGARDHLIGNILNDTLSFRWKPHCVESVLEGNVLTGGFFQNSMTKTDIKTERDRLVLRSNTLLGSVYWPGEALDKTDCFLNRIEPDKIFVNNYFASGENKLIAAARFADPAYCDYRLQADSPLKGKAVGGGDIGAYRHPQGRILFVGAIGDDAASGLAGRSAWKSLGKAAGSLQAGDTLYLLPGNYGEALSVAASGMSEAPIRVRAHGKGKVAVNNVAIKGAHIEIEGITVGQAKGDAFVVEAPSVTLRRCLIFDAQGAGVRAKQAEGLSVRQCTIVGNGIGVVVEGGSAGSSVRDSILAANKQGAVQVMEGSLRDFRASHNVYSGQGLDEKRVAGEVGSVIADPLFVNAANADYRLCWDSPAAALDAFCQPAGAMAVVTRPIEISTVELSYIRSNSVVAGWTTAADDTTGYVEYWVKGKNAKRRVDDMEQGTIHIVGIEGLEPSTVYECRVRAVGRRGGQADSAIRELQTAAEPVPPSTYYVSTKGNDAADGRTPGTAWRTIRQACVVVGPGDTVLIEPGVYSHAIMPLKSGRVDKPIIFMRNGEGQAIIDGGGVLAPLVQLVRKHHVTIEGLTFDNLEVGGRRGVFKLENCDGVRILKCRVGDKQAVNWESGGFVAARNCRDLRIEGNVCWGTDYPLGLADCKKVMVKNNTIVDATMWGSSIWGGDDLTIVNNLWFRPCIPDKSNTALLFTNMAAAKIVCDHNLFFSPYPSHKVGHVRDGRMETIILGENLDQWRQLSPYDTHSIQADPLFADYAKGDFRLRQGSPAIGKGKDDAVIGAEMPSDQ